MLRSCSRLTAVTSLTLVLTLTGCDTPEAVANFCSSASSSLRSGNAIFEDIEASCLRSKATFASFTSFEPKPLVSAPQENTQPAANGCEDYKVQVEGLKAASKILADYLVAMNQLAAFGSAKLADDGHGLAQKATSAGTKLTTEETGKVQALANVLAGLLASGYQRKHLDTDIKAADPDVQGVAAALKKVVEQNYLPLLDLEQVNLANRYQHFLDDHPCPAGNDRAAANSSGGTAASKPDHSCHLEAILQLQDRWQDDLSRLAAKRAAAHDFIAALENIAAGHSALAAHANRLNAKDLSGLLSPYSDQLQSLSSALLKK